jgi:hypothetical protein
MQRVFIFTSFMPQEVVINKDLLRRYVTKKFSINIDKAIVNIVKKALKSE